MMMSIKFKYFSIVFLIIFLFLLNSDFSFAAEFGRKRVLEVVLPGLPPGADLPTYIAYIFRFAMMSAGAIALIVLILGGVRYLTSAGNPEVMREARKRIFGAILGLVILLSSYLIIININPQLEKLEIEEKIHPVPGLFLEGEENGKTVREPAPILALVKRIKPPYTKIVWPNDACDKDNPEAEYIIYFFNDTKYKEIKSVARMSCNPPFQSSVIITGEAFWIKKQTPGVYFYDSIGCDDNSPGDIKEMKTAHTESVPEWDEEPKLIRSVRIVNGPDPQKGPFWGIVFYNWPDYRGLLAFMVETTRALAVLPSCGDYNCKGQHNKSRCYNLSTYIDVSSFQPKSVTIFQWVGYDDEGNIAYDRAGDGITLWSKPNWTGGYYHFKNYLFTGRPKMFMKLEEEEYQFFYRGTGVPPEEEKRCEKIKYNKGHCLQSIEIRGNYFLLLITLSLLPPSSTFQRFPISENLVEQIEEKYEAYDIKRGPIDLTLEWVYALGGKEKYLLIIPLAEGLAD